LVVTILSLTHLPKCSPTVGDRLKPTDLEKAVKQQEQIEAQRAYTKAVAESHVSHWERQGAVFQRVLELLPHPGVEGDAIYQHRLKAAALFSFGLAASYQVPFDDFVAFGREYYNVKLERVQNANRIEAELNAAKKAESESRNDEGLGETKPVLVAAE
jgi:hypothetical protein